LEAEDFLDSFRLEKVCGFALDELTFMDPAGVGGMVTQGVEVMADHEDCGVVVLVEAGEEVQDGFSGGGVESRGWFIEEEELGLSDECSGDEDALFLSAGELAEGGFGEVVGVGTFEAAEGVLFFVLGEEAAWGCTGVGSHEGDFEAIEEEEGVEAFVLGDVADSGVGVVGVGEGDGALEWGEDTGESLEEGRFS
jgi:hypothetical protein